MKIFVIYVFPVSETGISLLKTLDAFLTEHLTNIIRDLARHLSMVYTTDGRWWINWGFRPIQEFKAGLHPKILNVSWGVEGIIYYELIDLKIYVNFYSITNIDWK